MTPRLIAPVLLWGAATCGAQPAPAASAPFFDAARGPTPLLKEASPPRMTNWVNDDRRRPRNYDMQPPTIPHRIDSYQVDRYFNKCLDCHAKDRSGFTQAVPVSPTHYIDRSGRVLSTISTRRYFCLQCHVAQEPVPPLVRNDFEGVDAVTRRAPAAAPPKP